MSIFNVHLPKHRNTARSIYSFLRHKKLPTRHGLFEIADDNPIPEIGLVGDEVLVQWDGMDLLLRRTYKTKPLFLACEGKPVPLGKGFFIRFPAEVSPLYQASEDHVSLTWITPPEVSTNLMPAVSIRRVDMYEDHAVIVTRLFNIKVTW